MQANRKARVAVLLSTFNGAQFVKQQIASLAENATPFTLHWIDDHSKDDTRETVRAAALSSGVNLVEWHQTQHLGVPGAFFKLLECVDADVYLFCDQDDIWQAHKIDTAVDTLAPEVELPVLCFSDLLMFKDGEPERRYPLSKVFRVKPEIALQESRLFMSGYIAGNAQAFTRPLRDIFLLHKEVAYSHAVMHDVWMYMIAVIAGSIRFSSHAPTTLYRVHRNNASNAYGGWRGRGVGYIFTTWRQRQAIRRGLARQARGLILASSTLPSGPKLDRVLSVARLVATLERRQSLAEIVRLVRLGIMWPNRRIAVGFALACLCSDAFMQGNIRS